ncbi:MAG: hypothetical protein AAF934_05530 [Bacteroidota bacterium]
MKTKHLLLTFLCFTLLQLSAQVKYDEGRIMIDGIQLLQDSNDENAYYYLTRFIQLATKEDGTYEMLCIKYIGEDQQANGGLFHALM